MALPLPSENTCKPPIPSSSRKIKINHVILSFYSFYFLTACDSSNECLLESRYKNDSVVCDITPFNTNNPPCYGHWSKFDDCSCVNPDARISSVGATYWCNLDSNWDEALYELDCYGM